MQYTLYLVSDDEEASQASMPPYCEEGSDYDVQRHKSRPFHVTLPPHSLIQPKSLIQASLLAVTGASLHFLTSSLTFTPQPSMRYSCFFAILTVSLPVALAQNEQR